MRLKARHKAGAVIPTASMADIAFLLIVYFMLTLTLSAQQGLDFTFEKEESNYVDPVESVLVEVYPDGSLRVDRKPMRLAELLGYLAPRLDQNPDKPVILRPKPETPYGEMMRVFDLLRRGKDILARDREINIALPTEREVATFWEF